MSDNDVCEHQNANYLRMMSERDALRDVVRELDAVMHHHADRADAAEAPAVPDSADVTEKVAQALWQAETEYDYAWEPNADTYRDAARNLLAVLSDPNVLAGIAGVLREHGWVYTQPVTASRCVCDERPDDMAEHQATAVANWLRGRG